MHDTCDYLRVVNRKRRTLLERESAKMRKADVEIGQVYLAKVSGKLAPVKLLHLSPYNARHRIAENLRTKRQVIIRSAAKLRSRLEPIMVNGIRKWKVR